MFDLNIKSFEVKTTPNYDEKKVLERLKKGDFDAFNQIYKQYKFQITANIVRMVKSKELAVDLVQELFMKVWVNHAIIDTDKSFRAYIFTIASNLITDQFRKSKRDKLVEEQLMSNSTELYSHIEESIIQHEEYKSLYKAIAKLPQQCKKVFILHKLEGKTYQEISEILGISKSTVKGHIIRAGKYLKGDLNY